MVALHNSRRHLLRVGAASLALSFAGRLRAQNAAQDSLQLQRLGWAGVRLQLADTNIYLDPLVDSNVWGDSLRAPLPTIEPQPGNRFVLVTHRHPDHFDPLAVRAALGDGGTLLSADLTGLLPAPSGSRSRCVPLYEPQLLGEVTAVAVPAADGYGDPQVSWVLSAEGKRVFHAGDTLWHGHWWKIGRQYGPFDVACLPVNGARFGWRKPISDVPAVLTPEQAVAAAAVLGARCIVPIHYGVAPTPGYREVPDALAALRAAAPKRGIAVAALEPGQWLSWPASI